MIAQRPNDFLEIQLSGEYFYLIVLSKIVFLGGNIVFGFHGDGTKQTPEELLSQASPKGFNCCVDLLYAKRNGNVQRLETIPDTKNYWLTKYAKSPITLSDTSEKIWGWYIYSIHSLNKVKTIKFFARTKYKTAMEKSCMGFQFYIQMVKRKYILGESVFTNRSGNEN